MLGITQSSEWRLFSGEPEKTKNGVWNNPDDCVSAIISPDRETRGVLIFDKNIARSIRLDAGFPVLHGKNGEDGTVQGLLTLYGITKVSGEKELPAAVKLAFEYDDEIIIEENIPGFEIGCAVLGNDNLSVGVLDEIELADGFFDYKEKYTLVTSSVHVPARIPEELSKEAKETAKAIYKALGCSGFARVDMFITPSGQIVFNEVNTIPGFTAHSRYPNMLKAVGMTFEQVVNGLIESAVKK